jgi:cathepsin A (carboxypeptidase C)
VKFFFFTFCYTRYKIQIRITLTTPSLTIRIVICNWLGNKAWTEALEWPGQGGYKKATFDDLKLSSDKKKTIGNVKSSGNFTFIKIHAAGHMVPFDQPEASLDMLNRWLSGEWVEK